MMTNQTPAKASSPMKLLSNVLFGLFFVAVLALAAGLLLLRLTRPHRTARPRR